MQGDLFMERIKSKRSLIIIILLLVLAFASFLILKKPLNSDGLYPVNEYGQTYGKDNSEINKEPPDLIEAIGVDGTIGYIFNTDLNPDISTPEEAIEKLGDRTVRAIPLYEKDGRTIIGQFEIGGGELDDEEAQERIDNLLKKRNKSN